MLICTLNRVQRGPSLPHRHPQPGCCCGENTDLMATSSVTERWLHSINSQRPPPGFDKANAMAGGTLPEPAEPPPATNPLRLQVPSTELSKTPPATVTKHLPWDQSELCTSLSICRIEALVHWVKIPEQYKTPLPLEPTALHKNPRDPAGAKPLLIAIKNWLINLLPLMK